MKAVILAAGRGTRMKDLTLETPKPLLTYQGKTLIELKIEALPQSITEVVLVIGYRGENIRNYFGNSWNGHAIEYVEQKEMLGTADALFKARHLLNEPFMVLMGDDLYVKQDLETLALQKQWALLVEKTKEKQSGGKIIEDTNGHLQEIKEDKDGSIEGGYSYTGACLLSPEIFNLEMVTLPGGKEYGLPQTIATAVSHRPIKLLQASYWKRITAPEDLA